MRGLRPPCRQTLSFHGGSLNSCWQHVPVARMHYNIGGLASGIAEACVRAGSAHASLDVSVSSNACVQVKVLYKRKSRGYGVIVPTLD